MPDDDIYKRLRAGLVDNVTPIGINVSPVVQANPPVPCIEIFAGEEEPHLTMGGPSSIFNFGARVLVSYASGPQESQDLLDTIRANTGPKSLFAAIESDKTLGGACDDLIVRTKSEDRLYPIGGVTYLGFECAIEILT